MPCGWVLFRVDAEDSLSALKSRIANSCAHGDCGPTLAPGQVRAPSLIAGESPSWLPLAAPMSYASPARLQDNLIVRVYFLPRLS